MDANLKKPQSDALKKFPTGKSRSFLFPFAGNLLECPNTLPKSHVNNKFWNFHGTGQVLVSLEKRMNVMTCKYRFLEFNLVYIEPLTKLGY